MTPVPDAEPRRPIRITTGPHKGLVIFATPAEIAALWQGVDRQAAAILRPPSGAHQHPSEDAD